MRQKEKRSKLYQMKCGSEPSSISGSFDKAQKLERGETRTGNQRTPGRPFVTLAKYFVSRRMTRSAPLISCRNPQRRWAVDNGRRKHYDGDRRGRSLTPDDLQLAIIIDCRDASLAFFTRIVMRIPIAWTAETSYKYPRLHQIISPIYSDWSQKLPKCRFQNQSLMYKLNNTKYFINKSCQSCSIYLKLRSISKAFEIH